MELRRPAGRLGERLALATLLLTLAGLVWAAGTIGAYGLDCPGRVSDGIDDTVSAWPVGKECSTPGVGGEAETHVKPLFDGIEWVIVGLALVGAATGLVAVMAEIRRLRGSLARPWASHSPTSRPTS